MQLKNEVAVEFEAFEDSLSVDIDWDKSDTILRSREYVDHWLILVWDRAFKPYLGDNPDIVFVKGDNLLEFVEGLLLSNSCPIGNAFILHLGTSPSSHFLLIFIDLLHCCFVM